MAERSRRLRKKLRVGEFQEFGFSLSARVKDTAEAEALGDRFILEAMDANGLLFGGYTGDYLEGFVCLYGRGSVSEEQRAAVEAWLRAQPGLEEVTVGPLEDAWH